jgi:hypothetical protein
LWVFIAVLAAGCEHPEPAVLRPPGALGVSYLGAELALVQAGGGAGGSRQLTVRLTDALGRPVASPAFALAIDGQPLAIEAATAALPPGHLVILLDAGLAPARRARWVDVLSSFAGARPAGEDVLLYRRGATLGQLAGTGLRRARVAALIERHASDPPATARLPVADALLQTARELAAVAPGAPGLRALVAIADTGPEDHAVVATDLPIFLVDAGAADPGAALAEVSQRLAGLARGAHHQLVLCAGSAAARAALSATASSPPGAPAAPPLHQTVRLPAVAPEQRGLPCVAAALPATPRPIELAWTPAQRRVFERRVESERAGDSDGERSFAAALRFAPGELPVVAEAELRRPQPRNCPRWGYTIELDRPRALLPAGPLAAYHLLSLCDAGAAVRKYLALRLASELGLFPLPFGFVQVADAYAGDGLYMLVEKPVESLVARRSRVQLVARRDEGRRGALELDLKHLAQQGGDAARQAVARSFATLAEAPGEEALAALEEVFDLERYLDWLALSSALASREEPDGLYVVAAETHDRDGRPASWVDFVAWGLDDLFEECEEPAVGPDPVAAALSPCVETAADRDLLAHAPLHRRYVARLAALLAGPLHPDRVEHQLAATAAALAPFATLPELSTEEVASELAALREAYAARYAELTAALAALDRGAGRKLDTGRH